MKSENGVKKLVGLVDLGKESSAMTALSTGNALVMRIYSKY